jgi:hypothetical protein
VPLAERKTTGMDAFRRHLLYILFSGFVKRERPLSTLILAHPERGKTTEVMKFNSIGCIVCNDLTAYGLAEIITQMSEIDRKIFHHLVIPDLERIGARSRTVRRELLATLQVAMQEGLTKIQTHFTKLECNPPIRLGVIMCTTPDDLGDKRSVFRRVSFLSRLIPFTYDYSNEKKASILDYVKQEEHLEKESFQVRKRSKSEVYVPEPMKDQLKVYAKIMAWKIEAFSSLKDKKQVGKLIGVRALEDLICYLKAIALSNGRKVVTKDDFREFERLFKFFNFDLNELEYLEEN